MTRRIGMTLGIVAAVVEAGASEDAASAIVQDLLTGITVLTRCWSRRIGNDRELDHVTLCKPPV